MPTEFGALQLIADVVSGLAFETKATVACLCHFPNFLAPNFIVILHFAKTTLEICNMQHLPTWCLPSEAPEPAERNACVVTGLPAKYRDPVTGLPYATIEAFKIIRKKRGYR